MMCKISLSIIASSGWMAGGAAHAWPDVPLLLPLRASGLPVYIQYTCALRPVPWPVPMPVVPVGSGRWFHPAQAGGTFPSHAPVHHVTRLPPTQSLDRPLTAHGCLAHALPPLSRFAVLAGQLRHSPALLCSTTGGSTALLWPVLPAQADQPQRTENREPLFKPFLVPLLNCFFNLLLSTIVAS
jgi:hypothetical protein